MNNISGCINHCQSSLKLESISRCEKYLLTIILRVKHCGRMCGWSACIVSSILATPSNTMAFASCHTEDVHVAVPDKNIWLLIGCASVWTCMTHDVGMMLYVICHC